MNFGKFKDAESLLHSYENLEKEFTKKCQELARYKLQKGSGEKNVGGATANNIANGLNGELALKNAGFGFGEDKKSNNISFMAESFDKTEGKNGLNLEGGKKQSDQTIRKGVMQKFLDKVCPPEMNECSVSKIENGESVAGSDLKEAEPWSKSPFCGILEKVEGVIGVSESEKTAGESNGHLEAVSGSGGLNKNGSEVLSGNGEFNGSGNGEFNGSGSKALSGSGVLNKSGSGVSSKNETLSSGKIENVSSLNKSDDQVADGNVWSVGNDEDSNGSAGKNEASSGGEILEETPLNDINELKPQNEVVGTVTPEILEMMLEKARTDGIQDYIKRVLDKKSNAPKLLGKGLRGERLILNSGVKPLESIREAGDYILKNYFFD